jgi:hypothetical protein
MSDLVFGEEVELRPHSIDRYGRTVAQVIIDGNDVGIEMLRQGLVWVYDRYIAEASTDIQKSYRSAQEQTKAERLGMWSDPNCIPPWIFRHSAKAHQEQAIASNWMEAHQRHIDPNSSLTSPTPLELPLSPDEVWANTKSGKYWNPGSRYYGKTKRGEYMSEKEAVQKGYLPANGTGE